MRRTDQQNSHHSSANITTGCCASPVTSATNAAAAGVTSGGGSGAFGEGLGADAAGGGGASNLARGVEREIASSSAVISVGMSAKSGVLKYRSPVSGSITRTLAPGGGVLQTVSAPASVAPLEVPTKMPS